MTKSFNLSQSVNDNSVPGSRLEDNSVTNAKIDSAGIQSSKLLFLQSGTGAVSRTVESKLYEQVSVKDFGAVGDGVNNDTNAIQAAFNSAVGKTVFFPKTSAGYKITAPIAIPLNTSIQAESGSYIDLSAGVTGLSATANGVFYTTGGGVGPSLGGGVAATISKGDTTVSCNSAVTGLSPGDLIVIQNIADFSYSPYRLYYRQGEFQVVRGVSGNVITIADPVFDTYSDLPSIRVKKVTSTRCTISGLRFLGAENGMYNQSCLTVNFGQNVVVEGLSAINPSSQLVDMRQCYASEVRNCESLKSTPDAQATESNGIILNCCQGTWINNCRLYASYHAVSITSGLAENVVSRFCGISECELSSNSLWAVDFGHCAVEYCQVLNSRVSGGIQLSGNYDVIDGNYLIEKEGVATTGFVVFTETKRLNSRISNNYFYVDNYIAVSCGNSNYDAFNSDTEAGLIEIRNNVIDDPSGAKTYFDFTNRGCTGNQDIAIVGNTQLNPPSSTATLMRAIVISGSKYGALDVRDNSLSNGRLSVVTSGWNDLRLIGNTSTNLAGTSASLFFGGGENGSAVVRGNTLIGYGDQNRVLGTSGSELSEIRICDNRVTGGSASFCLTTGFADSVFSSGNTLGNPVDSQTPLRVLDSANTFVSGDRYNSLDKFPEFPTNGVGLKYAQFQINLTKSVAVPATSFSLYTVPTGLKLYVASAVIKTNTSVSATNGDYFGVGVDAANRRIDFGVSSSAATSSAYPSGTSASYLFSPATNNQLVLSGESLSLISVSSNTDNANLGSNLGGVGQSFSCSMNCQIIGQ
jgi:hypothetical protein